MCAVFVFIGMLSVGKKGLICYFMYGFLNDNLFNECFILP